MEEVKQHKNPRLEVNDQLHSMVRQTTDQARYCGLGVDCHPLFQPHCDVCVCVFQWRRWNSWTLCSCRSSRSFSWPWPGWTSWTTSWRCWGATGLIFFLLHLLITTTTRCPPLPPPEQSWSVSVKNCRSISLDYHWSTRAVFPKPYIYIYTYISSGKTPPKNLTKNIWNEI